MQREYQIRYSSTLGAAFGEFILSECSFDPAGTHTFKTRAVEPVSLSYVALDDPAGIEIAPLIAALEECGYDDWVSVHQPLRDDQSVTNAS